MRKGLLIVLAVTLVAVLAAPAMADVNLNGFYRAKGYMTNFENPGTAPTVGNASNGGEPPTAAYVEQRMRLRFSAGDENVKAIAFFEIDFSAWGDTAGGVPVAVGTATYTGGAQRNTGGALGGDRINLETKNVYVWFKIPNTGVDFTVGLQNQTDAYYGLIYGAADMAAIFANFKVEPVTFTLGWAKLYENNVSKTDDVTLYVAAANLVPTKDIKLGLNLYALQIDASKSPGCTATSGALPVCFPAAGVPALSSGSKAWIWTPGINFAAGAGPATLSGFLVYNWGEFESITGGQGTDIRGYAVDLRGDVKVGPGNFFLEGLYVSGGDDPNKYESIVTLSDVNSSPGGNSAFVRMDYSILMNNADDINTNTCLIGCAAPATVGASSPGNGGRGMWTIGTGFSMKLGEKTTGKIGAGYLQAVKMRPTDPSYKGESMGIEVNANVNHNIYKGLDFGLYGAYAWLGDFYKYQTTPGSTNDPDPAYDLHLRLNYAF